MSLSLRTGRRRRPCRCHRRRRRCCGRLQPSFLRPPFLFLLFYDGFLVFILVTTILRLLLPFLLLPVPFIFLLLICCRRFTFATGRIRFQEALGHTTRGVGAAADPGIQDGAPPVVAAGEALDLAVRVGVVEGETRLGVPVAGWVVCDDAEGLGRRFCKAC